MDTRKKDKNNFIKKILKNPIIARDNKNYLHIANVLKEVNSKSLKVSAFQYLLNPREEYYKRFIETKSRTKDKILSQGLYIIDTYYSDKNFSFENMFCIDVNNNLEYDVLEDLKKLNKLFFEGKIKDKEYNKQIKKMFLKRFNIQILSFFTTFNILLEINLNRPLEELQEILKLAKNFYDKNKEKILKNSNLEESNIIDEKLFEKIKNKRNSAIPFDEKLTDMIFIIDCLLMEYNSKEIKLSLQNYYINNYPHLDLSYILTDYYKNLVKEAKKIIDKIKKGV
jgi:hypothetical protein